MNARLQTLVLGTLSAFAWGCESDSIMSPIGGAGMIAAAGTTGAPPTTGGATAAGAASPSTAGRGAGTGAPTPTPSAGAGASAAGATAPAGNAGMAAPATAGAGPMAAGAGGATAAGTAAPAPTGGLKRPMTTDGVGPYGAVTKMMNVGPGGWLIFPKSIGEGGTKHPLFVFGPGGGTTPATYESSGMHWDRYGSYGFVIYAVQMSGQSGAPMKAAVDWLIAQNDVMTSPLYQKLDTTKIVTAGHSMGSIMTFAAQPDPRVTSTIHISGGSFDGMGPSKLTKPTMFLCGPSQSADTAYPQCERDFMNTKVPTFYTAIQGSDHLTSGRLGWPAIIAWLLWHIGGQEDLWKKEFLEPTGKFHMGQYKSQIKNW